MMKETDIQDFIDSLASKKPVPGGGSACAFSAALGTSLGSMVGNLTLGKKKYADVEEEIQNLLFKLQRITSELLILMDKDAEAFLPLSKAYSLPKETDEQRIHKETVMEEALFFASQVPFEIMEKVNEAIELLEQISKKGTRIAISDVAVGVQLLRAASSGSAVNIFINTKSMKNRALSEDLNSRAKKLLSEICQKADRIYDAITIQLTSA